MCTTFPCVSKSCASRRGTPACAGIRICRFEPIATSNRVRNAAPLRHKFSLAVSSSKENPRASQPRTRNGRRTAILRSDLFPAMLSLTGLIGWGFTVGGLFRKEAIHVLDHFLRRARRMHDTSKFAAVLNAVRKPACELLHFSHAVR